MTTKLKASKKAPSGRTKKKPVRRNARARKAPVSAMPTQPEAGAQFGLGSIDLEAVMTLPVGKDNEENAYELPDAVALNPRQKVTLLAAAPKMFAALVEVRLQLLPSGILANIITEALNEAYKAP